MSIIHDATSVISAGAPATVREEWFAGSPDYEIQQEIGRWAFAAPVWDRLGFRGDIERVGLMRRAAEWTPEGKPGAGAVLTALGLLIVVLVWDSQLAYALNDDGTRGMAIRNARGDWLI